MILAALLLTIQATPVAPPTAYRGNLTMDMELEPESVAGTASGDDEVTVTAKRIYRARMTTRLDRATRTRQCTLRRPLGIAPFDAVLCTHLLTCMSRNPTRSLVRACMVERMTAEVDSLQTAAARRSR